ncbi:MAG: rRNA maturation RNase YbeY [Lachnospiraceae bacterium]|jgi:probable rRNA maturation factor|nr:rRNA maturation RNase YbeY [Lachnospiraceae bacterium]
MTIHITNEQSLSLGFDYDALTKKVIEGCLAYMEFPYEAQVEVTFVDLETIHEINLEQRQINRPTDVLSFPMIAYDKAGDFSHLEEDMDNFEPESGEALLGDIVLCIPKVQMQAEEYGHSMEREFAFLICHSMLHLLGYDHMEKEEEQVMFAKQEAILEKMGITR